MGSSGGILLTGGTGLLGSYLLRDLLLCGRTVGVLVRDRPGASGQQRIDELLSLWSAQQSKVLPRPVVLVGDLSLAGLGLSLADRAWLSRRCRSVLHAGAHLSFAPTIDGEPWRTNFDGTRHLLDLCSRLGIHHFHHVSTAFVCGARTDTIHENDLDCGQDFHNDYERSKFAAEQLLRQAKSVHATIYRPSVIVGDSVTGFTSTYHGFYRFLELGDRLAEGSPPRGRRLALRLPFTGNEPRNLVTVDWVAQAIHHILLNPLLHGQTYHLVADRPIPSRQISEAAAAVLGIDGVSWVGPGGLVDPSPLEQLFQKSIVEYQAYWAGDPEFRNDNTRRALPDLPAPHIDRDLLVRLIRFAVADGWGRSRVRSRRGAEMNCANYIEHFFPDAVKQSSLVGVPLDVTVALEIAGVAGGCWSFRWKGGELLSVERGVIDRVEVLYRLDVPTFAEIISGRLSVQDAFFARRVEIVGHVEKGLKLAVLFTQFVREFPYHPSVQRETTDAGVVA
jgi:thioester reductase-like protein